LREVVDCSRMTSCVEGWTGETLMVTLKGERRVPESALGRCLGLCLGICCQVVAGGSTLEVAHRRDFGCRPFLCVLNEEWAKWRI